LKNVLITASCVRHTKLLTIV